jgi:aminoglycoside N3'-acetyltransferase
MPDQFKKSKLKKGETVVLFSHKLMALKWMDKKEVNVLSTIHADVNMTPTGKPTPQSRSSKQLQITIIQ